MARVREGSLCCSRKAIPIARTRIATEGIRIARAAGNTDLEMLGRAVQGLALVASGAVAEGMRALDEVNAAVVAGEMKDLVAIGLSCCYMIAACDRVRDYDRAVQWCTRLKAFCAKWGLRPLFAVCRTQYASICMWRGTWLEAEQELTAATDELAASRPAMTADGLVRLAELRRRQGRLVEAAATVRPGGAVIGLALLGRAELAFDRGDMRAAAEQAARYLRRVLPHNRTDRAAGLELLVARTSRAAISMARAPRSPSSSAIATHRRHRAAPGGGAACAAGWIALSRGAADDARRHLEDAVDGFLQSGAPFELGARADRAGARARRCSGATPSGAREEAQRAIDLLVGTAGGAGAVAGARAVATLAESQPTPPAILKPPATAVAGLHAGASSRCCVSSPTGSSNQTIAEQLCSSATTPCTAISPNIFNKLSVSSRAAAVAQAARRGLLRAMHRTSGRRAIRSRHSQNDPCRCGRAPLGTAAVATVRDSSRRPFVPPTEEGISEDDRFGDHGGGHLSAAGSIATLTAQGHSARPPDAAGSAVGTGAADAAARAPDRGALRRSDQTGRVHRPAEVSRPTTRFRRTRIRPTRTSSWCPGALTFGMGDKLTKGAAANKTLDAGGYALMPANMNHFAYTTRRKRRSCSTGRDRWSSST